MTSINKLFNQFLPATYEQWKERALKELKGKDFDALLWKPFEDITVQPYYTREHLNSLSLPDLSPGQYPYLRGNRPSGNDWEIRQDIKVTDAKAANKKALDALMKGASSVGFDLGDTAISKEIMDILLKEILPEYISLNFITGRKSAETLEALLSEIKKRDITPEQVSGSVDFDPLNDCLKNGNFDQGIFDEAAQLIHAAAGLPAFRCISVSGVYYSSEGASAAQEIAFSLAHGHEYLSHLAEKIKIDDLAARMQFTFGVGSSYLIEIAKLRAFRMLWARVVEQYKPQHVCSMATYIHCETSKFNLTETDPHTNILRATTEVMSAAVGGANSIAVIPFDAAVKESNKFSARIARNIQVILKEEAYMNKVADAAGGAYYIEALTDSLAAASWKLFQEMETKGGFISCIESGYIKKELERSNAEKKEAIASGKMVLVGVNKYQQKERV